VDDNRGRAAYRHSQIFFGKTNRSDTAKILTD
jgi:hypothetical protein